MTSSRDVELWLERSSGPAPHDLSARVAYWEGLERAFLRLAPPGLRWGSLPTARPPAPHALCERWLPLEVLREEVQLLVEEWFGPGLATLQVDFATSSLGRARSWLDARAQLPSLGSERLPSELLRRLGQIESAHALLFELFAAPRLGRGLTRYPAALEAIATLAGRRPVRAWDAGCAAGESSWALAAALSEAGSQAEVLGTTPWPLELLMAERGAFPHDLERSRALQGQAAALGARTHAPEVRFELGDLRRAAPQGSFDVVCCHGLLGGVIRGEDELRRSLEHLSQATKPGGYLSVQDTFRDDVHEEVLTWVRGTLAWPEPHPGVFSRPSDSER